MGVTAARLVIASPASNTGKTTVSCGLMRALAHRGLKVQACKCGPDYIDPMFHATVVGAPSRNLDLFFAGPDQVRSLVAQGAGASDITVIEGAMGYYDGIAVGHTASAWDVACTTQSPAILVVNGRGRALSIAAEVAGFAAFRTPSQVAGVVINHVSGPLYERLKDVIERETGVPALGYVPHLDDCSLESRHLGLVPAGEVADLARTLDSIASVLEQTLDIDRIVDIAQQAPELDVVDQVLPDPVEGNPVIALAYDDAFNFYYDDTLALFKRLGAVLVRFSPLADASLPKGTCGLYLGGGYPELNARALSGNEAMLQTLRQAIAAGMPTVAECGGFMYLHEHMEDDQGCTWPMVGAIAGGSFKTGKLGRFGYITLTAHENNLLCDAGSTLPAHEFHYWDSTNAGSAFSARKPQSTRAWECAFATDTLYAGYPHLYLASQPQAAKRFVQACRRFAEQHPKAG